MVGIEEAALIRMRAGISFALAKAMDRAKLLRIDQLKAVDIDQPTVGDL